jgi:hypothetical protein
MENLIIEMPPLRPAREIKKGDMFKKPWQKIWLEALLVDSFQQEDKASAQYVDKLLIFSHGCKLTILDPADMFEIFSKEQREQVSDSLEIDHACTDLPFGTESN